MQVMHGPDLLLEGVVLLVCELPCRSKGFIVALLRARGSEGGHAVLPDGFCVLPHVQKLWNGCPALVLAKEAQDIGLQSGIDTRAIYATYNECQPYRWKSSNLLENELLQ